MKKLQFLFLAVVISFSGIAQTQEVGPLSPAPNVNGPDAIFDLIEVIDVGSEVGANGLAAVAYFNEEYIVAPWDASVSVDFHRLDANGSFINSFQIPGVEGARSITTDGTSLFIGTAGSSIFEVDPNSMTLINTINVSSSAAARMCTYDETLDGGNGGFWIGSFANDIASVDMDGVELSLIPAAVHGTAVYGGAIDNVSPGGPFLWIHDQSGTAPNRDFITQLDPSTGEPTGVVYDFTGDSGGATEVLAGGLFITDELDSFNGNAFVGLCQCTPSNLVFTLELDEQIAGVGENSLQTLTLSPNPVVGGTVEITSPLAGEKQVAVYDVTGKMVIQTIIDRTLDVSSLSAGVYMVKINQNGSSVTKKLIKK